jgi:hypothetical protein
MKKETTMANYTNDSTEWFAPSMTAETYNLHKHIVEFRWIVREVEASNLLLELVGRMLNERSVCWLNGSA